ncbi:MAG TPA: hypothetical protein PLK10_04315, partial [Ottowia sp.]|nr:hypothetical protein [Ottowia sp.]
PVTALHEKYGCDACPASASSYLFDSCRPDAEGSDGVSEWRTPERIAETCPIKTQGADAARTAASICNAERAGLWRSRRA